MIFFVFHADRPKTTSIILVSFFQEERCRTHPQFLPRQTAFYDFHQSDTNPPKLTVNYYIKDHKDVFDGCKSDVTIYAMDRCLDADPLVTSFTYINCSMVKNYKVSCPWVEPTTRKFVYSNIFPFTVYI